MTVSNDDLLFAMENSLFVLPEVPGALEPVQFDGLSVVWSAATDFFIANLVGGIRLDADNVESTIQAVHEFYTSRDRAYGWFVATDFATPDDLGERLTAAGVPKLGEFAGMVSTDFDLEVKTNPDIVVRPVTAENEEDFIDIMGRGYPCPDDYTRDCFLPVIREAKGKTYVAYLDEQPISASVMFYMPDSPIAVLQGAATLEEHRGKGAYSALLKRRLQDAKADGMEAAILQADRSTSAPICAKYGFEELTGIALHGWLPEGAGEH